MDRARDRRSDPRRNFKPLVVVESSTILRRSRVIAATVAVFAYGYGRATTCSSRRACEGGPRSRGRAVAA